MARTGTKGASRGGQLFGQSAGDAPWKERLGTAAFVLRAFALQNERELIASLDAVILAAPFRNMTTPGGYSMSVAMTNCGDRGWVTDRKGYRYAANDPETSLPWPPIPEAFLRLATGAASEAGYAGFSPDACLINRYRPGSQLSLHQDRDERDFTQPIVSVSLGLPAVFLFGGLRRQEKTARVFLEHGDVVVWGGPDRLRYHGIAPLKAGFHPLMGEERVNLTFRKAA